VCAFDFKRKLNKKAVNMYADAKKNKACTRTPVPTAAGTDSGRRYISLVSNHSFALPHKTKRF
jgi:hypothetical protein